MRILTACLTLLAASPVLAQSTDDLTGLSDEFEGASLNGWTRFDEAFGWPDKIRTIDVGETTPGVLHIEPYHSAWVRDLNAPFLFREVRGDFDVRARVRVRSRDGDIPGGTWSLGGLMALVRNRLSAALEIGPERSTSCTAQTTSEKRASSCSRVSKCHTPSSSMP